VFEFMIISAFSLTGELVITVRPLSTQVGRGLELVEAGWKMCAKDG
jgi:hypothetical protein